MELYIPAGNMQPTTKSPHASQASVMSWDTRAHTGWDLEQHRVPTLGLCLQAEKTQLPSSFTRLSLYLLNEQSAFQAEHLGCKNADPGTYFKVNLFQNQNLFAIK